MEMLRFLGNKWLEFRSL